MKCALDIGHPTRVGRGETKLAESDGRGGETTDSALMHGRMVARETALRWASIIALMRKVLALVLVAACGDDEFNGLPDGPQGPDGTPDTPTEGLVKLTVTDQGLPRMGVKVYFQNSDSSVVSATMTDVNGVASAVMEAGGFVTAIQPFALRLPQGVASTDLKTFSGVKPLDELVLSRGNSTSNTVVNASLLINPDPLITNGGDYLLFAPCIQGGGIGVGSTGSGSGSGSGSLGGPVTFVGCSATTDLTIVVTDAIGVRSSIHKPNVTLTEGGVIDLTDLTYAPAESATWEFTNVPAFVGSFNVTDALTTVNGPQFLSFDGAAIDNATGITAPHARPVLDNSVQIVLSDFSGAPNARHGMLEWGAPATAYSKSLTDVLLSSYATLPEYSLANKSVSWTVDPGVAPDFAIIRTDLFREAPTLDWDWEIAAPLAAEATVRYPVLPAPDDQFNPITNDSTNVNRLTTAKLAGGYDAVREVVLSIDGDPNTGLPLELVAGATGRVVTEDIQLQQGKRTPKALLPFAAQIKQTLKAHRR